MLNHHMNAGNVCVQLCTSSLSNTLQLFSVRKNSFGNVNKLCYLFKINLRHVAISKTKHLKFTNIVCCCAILTQIKSMPLRFIVDNLLRMM